MSAPCGWLNNKVHKIECETVDSWINWWGRPSSTDTSLKCCTGAGNVLVQTAFSPKVSSKRSTPNSSLKQVRVVSLCRCQCSINSFIGCDSYLYGQQRIIALLFRCFTFHVICCVALIYRLMWYIAFSRFPPIHCTPRRTTIYCSHLHTLFQAHRHIVTDSLHPSWCVKNVKSNAKQPLVMP